MAVSTAKLTLRSPIRSQTSWYPLVLQLIRAFLIMCPLPRVRWGLWLSFPLVTSIYLPPLQPELGVLQDTKFLGWKYSKPTFLPRMIYRRAYNLMTCLPSDLRAWRGRREFLDSWVYNEISTLKERIMCWRVSKLLFCHVILSLFEMDALYLYPLIDEPYCSKDMFMIFVIRLGGW